MPKVFSVGRFDFFFYSNEGHEPIHIHVRSGSAGNPEGTAKFWLGPIRQAYAEGFSARELAQISRIIRGREAEIRAAWRKHFG